MLSHNHIITELAHLAPGIHISTTWEEDPDFPWDGDGRDPVTYGYYPHDVTVTAMKIDRGKLLEAESHLGGSYSESGGPHCPDIGGYFPQMLEEALDALGEPAAAGHVRQLIRADYGRP
jgi:hypothetical protein